MCGIAGMVGLPCDETIAAEIMNTMERRGPDGNGIYRDSHSVILHSRLAVIDLDGGKQPMLLLWGNETYIIAYNGELYNTEELRKELLSLGHQFCGHSDTEILLHAYVQWGKGCLDRLNGIFAFAVWEKNHRRLFLARDRMGVKPLFYTQYENGIIFASEIKSILVYPGIEAELDSAGAAQVLLLGPGRAPGSGVFRNICEMEPGYCGYWENERLQLCRYWRLMDREHAETLGETVEHVRALVCDAIRRQMVSDVPIGTFLSGGLDSSLISSICSGILQERGTALQTFSVDYKDNGRYFVPNLFQPTADSDYIHIMEQYLQTEHHWTLLTPDDLMNHLEAATTARDLPGMADIDFSLLAFCKQIRSHVKVALSGECADEIFGGYPWFRDPRIRALDGFPWAQNTAYRAAFLHPNLRETVNAEEFVREMYAKTITDTDVLPGTAKEERRMKEMVYLNQRWFMQTLLDRKDRMSMYSSLEVRVPFCDHRIAEYLYGVPWEMKDYNGKEKGLLRAAMSDFLPEQVLWRKKSPYPKTWDPRYLTLAENRLRVLLADKHAPIFQLVDRAALNRLSNQDHSWPWYGQLMKLPQTIVYMLQINFWLQHYHIRVL